MKIENLVRTTLILVLVAAFAASAAEKGKYKEARLELGEDGKLKYIPDEQGNLIPDFSRAGYMGGGVKIPDVPTRITLEPSGDETVDDSPRIDKALAELIFDIFIKGYFVSGPGFKAGINV